MFKTTLHHQVPDQVFLNAHEVIFTPHLYKRHPLTGKSSFHVARKLRGVESGNGRLQSQVERTFNGLKIFRQRKGLRLPPDLILMRGNDAGRRDSVQVGTGGRVTMMLLPEIAIALTKIA